MNVWDPDDVTQAHLDIMRSVFGDRTEQWIADIRAHAAVPLMMAAGFTEGQAAISTVLGATSIIVSAMERNRYLTAAAVANPALVTGLACAMAYFATTPEETT